MKEITIGDTTIRYYPSIFNPREAGETIFMFEHRRFRFKNELGKYLKKYGIESLGNITEDKILSFDVNKHKNLKYIAFKVYMYEHGDVRLSLNPFFDKFDSGLLGAIIVPKNLFPYKISYENKVHFAKDYAETELKSFEEYINGGFYDVQKIYNDGTTDWHIMSLSELEELIKKL